MFRSQRQGRGSGSRRRRGGSSSKGSPCRRMMAWLQTQPFSRMGERAPLVAAWAARCLCGAASKLAWTDKRKA